MEGLQTRLRVQQNLETSPESQYIVAVGDLPQEYRKEIQKGIPTGWKCLDMYLGGLRQGEMTVVTADTGVGKTTFCTQMMVNCALEGYAVWINSWEMRPEIMLRKVASVVLRKPLKFKEFTEEDSKEFDGWRSRHALFMNPKTVGMDISPLIQQMVIARDRNVRVVMLDHLDYLVSFRGDKLHEAIEETVKRLHEAAFDLGLHIVLICHPRQSANAGEEVGIHSLKGSSSIKQYADNVIVLHRCSRTDPQAHPSKTKVKVAKNRMLGIEGTTYLFYQELWDGYVELNNK